MKEDTVREEEFLKRMDKKQAFMKNPRYSKSTEQAQSRSGECSLGSPTFHTEADQALL